MDYYGLLPATDLWGLTAGKFDHSGFCRGRSVTFVYMEVRSRAGVRLLSIAPRYTCTRSTMVLVHVYMCTYMCTMVLEYTCTYTCT